MTVARLEFAGATGTTRLEVAVCGTVIQLTGDLDMATAPDLDRLIAGLLGDTPTVLVLDLHRLDFLGAAGITCLLGIRDRLAARRGLLVLRELPAQVRRVLEITQLLDQFDVGGSARSVHY